MKTTYLLLFTLLFSLSTFAQKMDRDKIKALKIAHITEQLDLSEKEAQDFWPIYNANEEAENKLRNESFEKIKEQTPNDLSENDAKSILLKMLSIKKEKQELDTKYLNDLLKILPAKKVLTLMQANRSFKHKMIEQFKQRHKGEKQEYKN
ncbi:sensor of ECF-type sigma factor [Lacinutrix sp. WUR7]|uniref:sensor of ECF-type sigma factor n=1 Tax=Lacinutrix sp. WUR7 TaxID=2653681 RepID=UPI00193EBF2E|nr:sensor of ECF-type sigma factor [Lacinutrix sp. WUR7]QRM89898.1 sensor of ECF-type sigma factor [Lacinutrix sp. WUR7]